MNISLKQASEILSLTEDELMFLHQTNNGIQAKIDEESMAWVFDINEVLALKAQRESVNTNEEE